MPSAQLRRTINNTATKSSNPIFDFYPDVAIRYVEAAEIDRFDPQHLSFFNINTEANLERARRLHQQGL